MDHADDDGDNNNAFVYLGGDQRVPRDVTHIRVHKSVKIIPASAFRNCRNLVSIELHDGVEIIEWCAFQGCTSLREIKLSGGRVIEGSVFGYCTALEDVEFGDKLETIGSSAFEGTSVRNIKLPKVRTIGDNAFYMCEQLTDVELSECLERIATGAFTSCPLRRIAIPLKANLLRENPANILGHDVFWDCDDLSTVHLVAMIHKTVSSLLLDSWRNEMKDDIDQINQDLTNTDPEDKTDVIQRWMHRVIRRIEHFKREHNALLKEFTTLLELALWKAKLDEMVNVEDNIEMNAAKIMVNDDNSARRELRVTSGANIVIKNVLPFLALE